LFLKFFKKWLHKEIESSDYRIFKSFYLKVNKNLNYFELFKDRIVLLLRVLIMPIFLRYKKEKNGDNYIIDSLDNYQLRKEYIAQYNNDYDIKLIDNRMKSMINIQSFSQLWIFFKSYIYSLKSIFKIIFLPLNFSFLQFSNYFYLRTKINIYRPQKIYVFYSYLPHQYLISLFSANVFKIEVNYHIGNMIYEYLRYFYIENSCICFANKLYKEEYESFKKIGWIKDINTKYQISGNEFLLNSNSLNGFKYDVGFFSSGYWSRREGLYASNDIFAIHEKKYENNIYSKREIILLRNIIKISKKHHLTLKIYLHPHEKKLISNHNIYPPYWNLIKMSNLKVDKMLGSNNFFEPKVGVLIQSSIFYDRWENNLFTLCYQFKNYKNRLQIPLKYLGKYSIYGFKNLKELEKKILVEFKNNE